MDLDRIREASDRVARSLGLEIFDVEWKVGKGRLLRVYIDRPPDAANPGILGNGPGVTHKDCERVSEQLSVILDVEDLVPGPSYTLEVSSPGLDRKLIRPGDYERFQGRLAGYADGIVKVTVRDREIAVPFVGIRKANLVVEL